MSYISHYYPRAHVGNGGVTQAMWLWARALDDQGFAVQVLYDPRGARPPDNTSCAGIRSIAVAHSGRGRAVRARQLGPALRDSEIVVLHSGYIAANLLAARAALRADVAYVVVPHGAYDPHLRIRRRALKWVWEQAERWMLEHALAVHVFFEQERDHVLDLASAARVIVAPTGYEAADNEWNPTDAHDYIAWLGRYDVQHKGLDRLLDAVALVPPAQRMNVRLHGRDSTNTRADVQRMVVERGLREYVSVGPPLAGAEKDHFLLGARGYVHPSRWESYGIALIENLARGIPSLVTSDISISDTLAAHAAALVVGGTPAALAEGLRRLTKPDSAEIGRSGRALVRSRFSQDAAARAWVEGLRKLGTEIGRKA